MSLVGNRVAFSAIILLIGIVVRDVGCVSISSDYSITESQWRSMVENRGIYSYQDKSVRTKRFISLENLQLQLNEEFQACTAPGGKPGHCRHLHYCIVDEIKTSYAAFMGHMCKIGAMMIGVCCPDKNITNAGLSERLIEEPKNELSMVEGRIVFSGGSSQRRGCGLVSKSRSKIVGGRPADPKDWPWMAALLRDRSTQYCGGVLITNRHVMTAAHCTADFRPSDIRVRLGEYDFGVDSPTEQTFRVLKINQHPNYDDGTSANDIAVLTMIRAATFDDHVWPICLPGAGDTFENKTATVTGWGTLGFGQAPSDVLMEVDFPIWSKAQCETKLGQSVPETQMCAGSFAERKDACQGDSGGPLMYRLSTGRWLAVGVVSYGRACGMIGQPGIYTRVNQYLPWIIESTRI